MLSPSPRMSLLAVLLLACQASITGAPDGGDGDGACCVDAGGEEEPCGTNEVPLTPGQLARPTVSVDRGYFDSPFDVVLTSDTPGAEIAYTLDGSEPTSSRGMRGPSPITVAITTTTVLRARALPPSATPNATASTVATYSYLFTDKVLAQPRAPAGYPLYEMGGIPLDYEMDPDIVAASGPEMREGLLEIPTISIAMRHADLFGAEGIYNAGGSGMNSAFERAASVEVIMPNKRSWQLQIDAGIRPHTHKLVKRSFKLLFKKTYGPGKMESCLMRGAPLSQDGASTELDSLILRGGTNRCLHHRCNPDDSIYIEDQWMHDTQIAMSGNGARGTFVHVFLNGLYFGLYNAMERPDDGFLAAYFGGKKTDWFSVNHGGPVDGDPTRWNYLIGPLVQKDMRVAANYEELKQYLDVEHFIDYILLNWFAGRTDWPNNNWYAGNRNSPPGPVRFFIWDADEVWDGRCQGPGDPTPDIYGARVLPPFQVGSTDRTETARIWHAARRNPDFMALLVQRADRHLGPGGALSEAASVARLDTLSPFIERAFLAETARWGDARASEGERTRTRENMWRPTLLRLRNERIPGNGQRLIQSMRQAGFYPP